MFVSTTPTKKRCTHWLEKHEMGGGLPGREDPNATPTRILIETFDFLEVCCQPESWLTAEMAKTLEGIKMNTAIG